MGTGMRACCTFEMGTNRRCRRLLCISPGLCGNAPQAYPQRAPGGSLWKKNEQRLMDKSVAIIWIVNAARGQMPRLMRVRAPAALRVFVEVFFVGQDSALVPCPDRLTRLTRAARMAAAMQQQADMSAAAARR